MELPTDIVEQYLLTTVEPQLHEQQEQPTEQPQPGQSQLQPPVAAVLPKTLKMQDKNQSTKENRAACVQPQLQRASEV